MGDVPAGLYEHLLTNKLQRQLSSTEEDLLQLGALHPADAHDTLTRHIALLAHRALRTAGGDDQAAVRHQVELANSIVKAIGALAPSVADDQESIVEPAQTRLAVAEPSPVPAPVAFPDRPAIPLTTSALLVNGPKQPRIGYEVARELASADDVDLLCAFI